MIHAAILTANDLILIMLVLRQPDRMGEAGFHECRIVKLQLAVDEP